MNLNLIVYDPEFKTILAVSSGCELRKKGCRFPPCFLFVLWGVCVCLVLAVGIGATVVIRFAKEPSDKLAVLCLKEQLERTLNPVGFVGCLDERLVLVDVVEQNPPVVVVLAVRGLDVVVFLHQHRKGNLGCGHFRLGTIWAVVRAFLLVILVAHTEAHGVVLVQIGRAHV